MRLAPADPIAIAISAPMPFDAPVSSMVLPARSTIALPSRARLLLTETCILLEYTFARPSARKIQGSWGERHGDAGAKRPPLDGKFPARAEAADAGRDRRRLDRAVVRADSRGSSPA